MRCSSSRVQTERVSMTLLTTTPLTPTITHMILFSATRMKSIERIASWRTVGMNTTPTWSLSLERSCEACCNIVDRGGLPDFVVDGFALVLGERAGAHQMIDEETVAAVGGDATRGRVRLGQVAEALEVGHDVAEAGRGQLEASAFRERAGADRLAARDV